MKPVRLTMQAFGPYAGREVVDFRNAVEAGLFGIYGQTGSGKSTIFSAMTFALFGQAAKVEQDAPTLRCDSADEDLATEVEFVFDIADKRYVVRRRPEQCRPKQRGTGETRDAHEAWLFNATGLALDAITPDNPGKVIEEKKVALVGKAIEELLGYGAHQFRQIVLLPQGRFEAFLAADTKARLAILRDLFDVSLYRGLAASLKADAETSERKFREERAILAGRLQLEGFESLDALKYGIATADGDLRALQKSEDEQRARLKQNQTALEGARVVEGLFQAAERAKSDLETLANKSQEIETIELRYRAAEKTASLLAFEELVTQAEQDLETVVGAHTTAEERSVAAAQEAETASISHQDEEARAHEIGALAREVETLARHQISLEKSREAAAAAEMADRKLTLARRTLQTSTDHLAALSKKRRDQSEGLKTARLSEAQRLILERRLAALEVSLRLAENVEKAEQDVATSLRQIAGLTDKHHDLASASSEARLAFDHAERRLSDVQALYLAQKLQPGEPCPVCGATHHPDPSIGSVEHAELDIAFRDAREELDKLQSAERDAYTELASARGILSEREDRLAALERPHASSTELREDIATVKAGLEALGPAVDIQAAESDLEQLDQELATEETTNDKHRHAVQQAETEAASASTLLAAMLAEIPEELRNREMLDATFRSKQQVLARRENARRASGEALAKASEQALAARKDLEAAEEIVKDRQQRLTKARADFALRLAQANLTEDAYQRFKSAIVSIEQDRSAVETYRREVHAANDAARRAEDAIAGRERPNLSPLDDGVREVEGALQSAQALRADAAARLGQLNKLLVELAETIERLDRAEAESGPLRELAALMDAKNPFNLDLETFAIGAMFDRVLTAANQRFGPMSNGRYRLERAVEGSGRGRRGLGIQVHDIHTGKPRPTTTLSGGEGFIAALALALGLADVVESANGKVRLDTIFIDEGFGSLDTENGAGTLDQVLQALNSLVSENRSVGLISHVPLVQEVIPNGFYVRKELSGSHIEHRGTA
ncbi:AAA family ATPase [Sinorhizobium meliloti]|uniref:AAA family ATPase n=1 Tax=Rhizobium meliloti TaxID=382 RepID=UPI000FDC16E8|nr:SMC family ATPase [Sinorhizobium meliloti]MDW9364877.1 SMC family ATPase [Sinorhizobium meliloti]MDW9387567.1 AAA family ATPase [Sinorhizobium meliloti]RVP06372.1 SMC family ATPase [Sinorhizobium meliloti]